jgi:uncharacterized protein (TIGR03083 family)
MGMDDTDSTDIWKLTHQERAAVADMLEALTPEQWARRSACGDWTVAEAAGHIVAGAEQSTGNFLKAMAGSGFRFNTAMDKAARRLGAVAPAELIERLRARTTTTNKPPGATAKTMLGEVVVHGEDLRRPLGITAEVDPAALLACLDMYKVASFPVGTKKRIEGLRLVADDVDWSHGSGPEVTGPALALLHAMTGRRAGLDGLAGAGLATLRQRMP